MITLARESREVTLAELSQRLGLSQGHVSKMASGLTPILDEHVAAIADVLEYPVEFFYQQPDVYGDATACLFHRKRQAVPAAKLKAVQAGAKIAAIATEELLRDVDIEVERGFPRYDLEDFDSPEAVAQKTRLFWRIPTGPVKNIVRVIESAGGIVIKRFFGTRKVDAISHWPPHGRPVFIVNSEIPTDRLRFTLAHEIGHLVMHTLLTDDPEGEAQRFAAEFLMPAQDIAPDLQDLTLPRLAALKGYWRVSMAAIVVRAHRLGTITERQYRRFMQVLRARYGLVEPNPLSVEDPALLSSVLAVHFNDHGLSIRDMCAVTRLSENDFRDYFMVPRTVLRLIPS